MANDPARPRRSSRLLFESALIVASVALGFLVTEWRERASDRELARRILTNIVEEVAGNRARMAEQVTLHRTMLTALEQAAATPRQSGWEAVTGTIKEGPQALPMRRAAWDAALSSGALRLIDYDVAARLSDIYQIQTDGYGRTTQRMGESLFVPEAFNPASAGEILQMFRWLMNDLHGQETYILSVYDRHLPALRDAAAK